MKRDGDKKKKHTEDESNSTVNQELICKGWFLPPNTYDCGSKLHFCASKSLRPNQEFFRCANYKDGRGEGGYLLHRRGNDRHSHGTGDPAHDGRNQRQPAKLPLCIIKPLYITKNGNGAAPFEAAPSLDLKLLPYDASALPWRFCVFKGCSCRRKRSGSCHSRRSWLPPGRWNPSHRRFQSWNA